MARSIRDDVSVAGYTESARPKHTIAWLEESRMFSRFNEGVAFSDQKTSSCYL